MFGCGCVCVGRMVSPLHLFIIHVFDFCIYILFTFYFSLTEGMEIYTLTTILGLFGPYLLVWEAEP